MKQKKNTRTLSLVLTGILLLCLVCAGALYMQNRPQSQTGTKSFEVTVVDDNNTSVDYKGKTDEEYLRGALEGLEGFSMSGTESEYGLMVEIVNGLQAVYEEDNAYWSFYVNDEYCNYGVDTQPVNDGDHFKIVYTPAE